MTTCDKIQPQLTAYLDGELADGPGSVVRGHLRECAACRVAARDEAALRDGLRTLAPVDPPASLWAGVQARLAAAEVADARAPWWRRQLAGWAWPRTLARAVPQLAVGGLVAAAAVAVVTWRAHREPAGDVAGEGRLAGSAPLVAPQPAEPAAPPPAAQGMPGDVTADLAAEPARLTASHAEVIDELIRLATEARPGWSDARRAAFDAELAALATELDHAEPGRAQQRVQRRMIRALQAAVTRDEIMLASGGVR